MLCHHGSCLQYFKQYLLPNYITSWAETWWEASRQNRDPELLKSFHSDIKDGLALNSHLGILQIMYSSKSHMSSWAETRQHGGSEWIMSFYLDIKYGQELNSNLYILQTTSSSITYVLISRNLIGYVRPKRDSEMLLPVHSDTKDGHTLNSLHGIFQTISSNIYIFSWTEIWMEELCNMETQNQ